MSANCACLRYIFVQFSDMLVYTSRIATTSLQFKVHGQLPLKGMAVSALHSCILTLVMKLFAPLEFEQASHSKFVN